MGMKAKFVLEGLGMLKPKSPKDIQNDLDIRSFMEFWHSAPKTKLEWKINSTIKRNPFNDVISTMNTSLENVWYSTYPEKWIPILNAVYKRDFLQEIEDRTFEIIHRNDGNYLVFPGQHVAFFESDVNDKLEINIVYFSKEDIVRKLHFKELWSQRQ